MSLASVSQYLILDRISYQVDTVRAIMNAYLSIVKIKDVSVSRVVLLVQIMNNVIKVWLASLHQFSHSKQSAHLLKKLLKNVTQISIVFSQVYVGMRREKISITKLQNVFLNTACLKMQHLDGHLNIMTWLKTSYLMDECVSPESQFHSIIQQ